jgi:hypothetical protein
VFLVGVFARVLMYDIGLLLAFALFTFFIPLLYLNLLSFLSRTLSLSCLHYTLHNCGVGFVIL